MLDQSRTLNWCGYATDDGCGYICSEGTDYCHHCGRRPVEKVQIITVDALLSDGLNDAWLVMHEASNDGASLSTAKAALQAAVDAVVETELSS